MATAQEVYKALLRDHLSPQLRELGFKGSEGAYELKSDSHWALLGVQASAYSDAQEVKFTINCQVVSKTTWSEFAAERSYLGAKPKPNTVAGNFVWWQRIGSLMPGGDDHWWTLSATDDAEVVARDVLDAVRRFALPAMESELRSDSGAERT